ncbi:MAG: hypothetical protein ABSB58_01675 [Gemmatimonadales bacterium]|jgi:hypothetical protein
MRRINRALSGLLVAVAFTACSDVLNVQNLNNPDRLRVLGRPTDVEALISGSFATIFNGTFGTDGVGPSARTMSWENASNLANWGLGPRSAIPRPFLDNTRGNPYQGENSYDFSALSKAERSSADGINRFTLGGVTLGNAPQNARAKAFGWFCLGLAEGYLSLTFDSSTAVDPYADLAVIPDLSGYNTVNVAALAALDSAVTWATTAGTSSTSFPLPSGWINGNAMSQAQFIQLAKSFKAYFRANVARTPADRAAVNWTAVQADAAAGITADIQVTTGTGWVIAENQWWLYQQWGQLNQMIGGMADSTGAYDAWLASPNKVQILIQTADKRFPSGNTRAAQIANSPAVPAGASPGGKPYFRNRSTSDPDAAPWSSYYDWYRMLAWYQASSVGPFPWFTKAQNDLLQAEAYLNLPSPNIAAAAALIDNTRVPNGLPKLAGVVTTATQAVPGGNACVPRVPQAPGYTTAACGNIMEAMKWEYRLETMYVSYISQFYSGRGWGDLPNGTPIQWPVPYGEMDTRRHPFYNMGGVGNPGGAVGVGHYGY